MEKIQILTSKLIWSLSLVMVLVFTTHCSTKKYMEDDDAHFKDINEEFEKVVTVDKVSEVKSADTHVKKVKKVAKEKKESSHYDVKAALETSAVAHQPDIEDAEGFTGRRPNADPFVPGEKTILAMNYFAVKAGDLSLNVNPYKKVNDRKAYDFSIVVKSNRMFSMFYSIENKAETFVDFENLRPLTYSSESKETSRRKEVRTYFDWTTSEATHWEKTLKKGEDEQKKKIVWSLDPYAQNFISALFYLRTFQLAPGKKVSFHVADAGKNYVFHAEVLRKEKLSTDIGELDTLVIKPTFELGDNFAPTGENLIWVTDDDRKFVVRLELKIKIGTIVGQLKSIERGQREN